MSRISKQILHLKSSNLFKCKQILMLMFVIKFIVFIKGITNDHVGSGQTEGDKIRATKKLRNAPVSRSISFKRKL